MISICSSSLAKIDQFGRYIPLFDNTLIIDDSKFNNSARNRLKNTLDRYLNQAAAKVRTINGNVKVSFLTYGYHSISK